MRYIDADAFFQTFAELNTEPYIRFPTTDEYEIAKDYCQKRCLAMVDVFYLRKAINGVAERKNNERK